MLGPSLFNIFVNDLFLFVDYSDICNYADDKTLSVADVNIEHIINKLESDIRNLDEWFQTNYKLLNQSKCQFLIIESNRTQRTEKAEIKLSDKYIAETSKGKLLGIQFDNKLTMSDHIKQICIQASNKLYALARISQYLDEQKGKILMKSFITSKFNYCPIIWMYCQRKSNNLINRIHERASRLAYTDYSSDFNSLLEMDNSVTIHHRNILCLLKYTNL